MLHAFAFGSEVLGLLYAVAFASKVLGLPQAFAFGFEVLVLHHASMLSGCPTLPWFGKGGCFDFSVLTLEVEGGCPTRRFYVWGF